MRLTTKTSIMGRKHDIAYGCASIWKKKLKNDKYELIENAVDKLGQLEDLEEKLGISLATLFEALSQRVYIKDEFGLIKPIFIEHFVLSMKGEELHTRGRTSAMHDKKGKILGFVSTPNTYGEYHFGLKDYGKTWALTKEELEK